ncbi:MAG: ribonuclease HII [Desulfurococcaceae archaeon]
MKENSLTRIGIDEAGRGPLIGDMIVSGVLVSPDMLEKLKNRSLKESKRLSPKKRYWFYKQALREGVVVVAVYVHPWRMDRENLNDVEEECIGWILRILCTLIDPDVGGVHIYVDEIKGRASRIRDIAETCFKGFPVEFVMEPGADARYLPVALASIFAKVMRDLDLVKLRKHVGNFGSGYPADPLTKKWLKEMYTPGSDPPLYVRRSWRVLKNIAPTWYREKRRGGKAPKHKSLLDYARR